MIREMEIEDLEQILPMEEQLFPGDGWDRKTFLYELQENPYAALFAYEEDGVISGYVDVWVMYEQAQIADIGVALSFQHKGIGSQLLCKAIEVAETKGCETMSLEVRCSNEKAIGLYDKYGFIDVGRRKRYYADGEDARLMVKALGGIYDTDISN